MKHTASGEREFRDYYLSLFSLCSEGGNCQTACKPGSVPPNSAEMAIHLGRPLPDASRDRPERRCEGPPGSTGKPALPAAPTWSCSRWGLPSRRRCRRRGALLPHHFTLASGSPESRPDRRCVSVALSLGSPPPGVTRHRASVEPGLSSPSQKELPRPGAAIRPSGIRSDGTALPQFQSRDRFAVHESRRGGKQGPPMAATEPVAAPADRAGSDKQGMNFPLPGALPAHYDKWGGRCGPKRRKFFPPVDAAANRRAIRGRGAVGIGRRLRPTRRTATATTARPAAAAGTAAARSDAAAPADAPVEERGAVPVAAARTRALRRVHPFPGAERLRNRRGQDQPARLVHPFRGQGVTFAARSQLAVRRTKAIKRCAAAELSVRR
jgi:hypothetical protein